MKTTPEPRRRTAALLAAALIASSAVTVPRSAQAYNVYYDLDMSDVVGTSAAVALFFADEMMAEMIADSDLIPERLPSIHEATLYRAVDQVCAAEGGLVSCGLSAPQWNDGTFTTCLPFTTCCSVPTMCWGIGHGGWGWKFHSLLVGARFPDMREMSGLEAANLGREFLDPLIDDPYEPWENRLDQAYQFPAQHAFGVRQFLEDNDRLFRVPWTTVTTEDGEEQRDPVSGVIERNQALLTATASFLVDRFFQAQRDVTPLDPATGLPRRLVVTDFTSIEQALGYHWRVGLIVAAASYLSDSVIKAALSGGDPLALGLSIAGLLCVGVLAYAASAPSLDDAWWKVFWEASECWEDPLAFMDTLDWLFDGGELPTSWVRPDLLAIGQGIHAIGDSFAHTIRAYENFAIDESGGKALPVASIRSGGRTPWLYAHSSVMDHDAMWYFGSTPWGWDETVDEGDGLFVDLGVDSPLGRANYEFSAQAVADWLSIFYTRPGIPEPDFPVRYAALKQFIKRYFRYAVPQEISRDEAPKYRYWQRCGWDPECTGAFAVDGGTEDGVCDVASGICRRLCVDDDDCLPGFSCSSGVGIDSSTPVPERRFCSALWDPWESVGDEYFIGVQREPVGEGDWGGKRWLPKTSAAGQWYMFEKNDLPFGLADENSWTRIDPAVAACEVPEGDELVAVLFEGLSYSWLGHCIFGPKGGSGEADADDPRSRDPFPPLIQSIYVAPRRYVCLFDGTDDDAAQFCLYGGINGTAEGRLMRNWRDHVKRVRWTEINIDHDAVTDAFDNCLLAINSDQADLDGDGYGDACDRDVDGDLVLEDGDGPFGFGDGRHDPCTWATMGDDDPRGEVCDDNCLRVYNPAIRDLVPLPYGDNKDDQFDLDGDGEGDACDLDPDGDQTGFEEYTYPGDYGTADEQEHPRPLEPTRRPFSECADYLWFLSEDKDDDTVCDLYNFIPYINFVADWMPDPTYTGMPRFGRGYLKPVNIVNHLDTANAHYLSSRYRAHVGQCGDIPGCVEVHVDQPPDLPGGVKYPGEGGYTWDQTAALVPGGWTYFGYEGCMRNLVDLWHYYGGRGWASPTIQREPGTGALEVTFREPLSEDAGGLMSRLHRLWNPSFTPNHAEGDVRSRDEWYAMLDDLKERGEALERSLTPDVCRVDNCIRFTRLHGPHVEEQRRVDIDALGFKVMDEDQQPPLRVGSWDTRYCWTENLNSQAGDEATNSLGTQIYCDFCDALEPGESPASEAECRPDTRRDETSPGYTEWYRNRDQFDTNRDGIGDKCSIEVDIADLSQDHVTQRLWEGTWTRADEWRAYARSTAIHWTADGPVDDDSGLPIRNFDDWSTAPDREPLIALCDTECGPLRACRVEKHRIWPKQKMEFAVSVGEEVVEATTLGACACALPDERSCYDEFLQRCWRPEERGWETDPDGYDAQARARESITLPAGGTRPRYAGFRFKRNRPPETYDETITEVCQPQTPVEIGWPFGPDLDISVGWDLNETTRGDGCQEIAMSFEGRDRRRLEWGYIGQVEPDPDDLGGEAAFLRTFGDGKGDQLWMDGYTTAMRIGIHQFSIDSDDRWGRQWYTPVYPREHVVPPEPPDPPDGSALDRDRPLPEGEGGFPLSPDGAVVGLVFYEPVCGGFIGPDTDIAAWRRTWPWEEVEAPAAESDAPDLEVDAGGATGGMAGSIAIEVARLMMGSGDVVRTHETYEVAEAGFPQRDFVTARLVLDGESAARLFGYAGDDPAVTADLVIGGAGGDGQPLSDVWVSRSWDAGPTFERLTPPAAAASAGTGENLPPPTTAPPLAQPGLYVDVIRERVLVLGGRTTGGAALDEIYAFDLATRRWTTSLGPGGEPVALPADAALGELAIDRGGRRAFLVATSANGVRVHEVDLDLSVPVLHEIVPVGLQPAPRQGAAVAYSSDLDRLLLFGGQVGPPILDGTDVPASVSTDGSTTPGGDGAFLGDVWGFDPRKATWSLLRPDTGPAVARADAVLVAGNRKDAYVLAGRDQSGWLPVNRAFRVELGGQGPAGWRTTDVADPRLLVVDGPPHDGAWRPGDPPLYTVRGRGLQVDLSKPAQIVLEADPKLLGIVATASTSPAVQSAATGEQTARATLALLPGEQYYVALRGLTGTVPQGGIPYSLRAASVLPRGRPSRIRAPRATRFDVAADIVYVANWSTLDVYRWADSALTKVASLAMQAAVDVDVSDGIAYVADFEQGLVTVNVQQPEHPAVLDTEWVLGSPDSVAVHGNRVFAGVGIFGVAALDASDPADVVWVEQIVPGGLPPVDAARSTRCPPAGAGTVTDVSVSGNYLLIGDASRTVWVYGVGAGDRAEQRGSWPALVAVDDTAVHGTTLYVTDGRAAMEIVDVTDPASPRRITVAHGPETEVSARYGSEMIVETDGDGIAVRELREVGGRPHGEEEEDDDGCDDDHHDHGDGDHGGHGDHGHDGCDDDDGDEGEHGEGDHDHGDGHADGGRDGNDDDHDGGEHGRGDGDAGGGGHDDGHHPPGEAGDAGAGAGGSDVPRGDGHGGGHDERDAGGDGGGGGDDAGRGGGGGGGRGGR